MTTPLLVTDSRAVTDPFIVTVDGPSGAGKGTLCQLLAQKTGFHLLDSGALYRLTALAAMQKTLDFADEASLAQAASELDIAFLVSPEWEGIRVLLGGQDVSQTIRDEVVGMGASQVAALPSVRHALLARQRSFAQLPGLVADGRDMGTVVFPQANVKLFLTASSEARAERRVRQLLAMGKEAHYAAILHDIDMRDKRDSERTSAPLRPAADAILIDSTELAIDAVLAKALALIAAKRPDA